MRILPTALSATCSCKPKSCMTGRPSSAHGDAARRMNRHPGCFTCWQPPAPVLTSHLTKQIAPNLSGGVARPPIRWYSIAMMAHCRTRQVRCSILSCPFAALSGCHPTNRRPCRSSPVLQTRARPHWLCLRSIVTGTSLIVPLRWHGSKVRRCCATSMQRKPMRNSLADWPVQSFLAMPCAAPRPPSLPAISSVSQVFGALPSRVICPSSCCA